MKSFIPYLGGKSRLAKQIISMFPEHTTYVEVFSGAANIFFRKEPVDVEVINDINSELINLYRVVRHHIKAFCENLEWMLVSRSEYRRFLETPPEVLTDIQRAVRYYYLAKTGFGGHVTNQSFGYAPSSPPRFNYLKAETDLSIAHQRLCDCYIENLPYADLIRRYDRPYTLFYLDPPYYGCTDDYGKHIFSESDYVILADILSGIKGKFCLSLNDVPTIRDIYSQFRIVPLKVKYSVSRQGNTDAKEVVIMNY